MSLENLCLNKKCYQVFPEVRLHLFCLKSYFLWIKKRTFPNTNWSEISIIKASLAFFMSLKFDFDVCFTFHELVQSLSSLKRSKLVNIFGIPIKEWNDFCCKSDKGFSTLLLFLIFS